MRMPSTDVMSALGSSLRGLLIGRNDSRYERARRVWNGRVDRKPLAIAQCADAADVIRCVKIARERELALAIRGGGHAVAGTAVCDGGLVADLSRMKGIHLSPREAVVRAEPGVTWGELDRATQASGFAVPGGTDSEVGIAGLSLGGGNGWLMGAFGATCDNLLAMDVVSAEGTLLNASAAENEDLFWALRGGGGNFGIVTSFEFRMYQIGTALVAGAVLYPFAQAREVLARFRDFAKNAPDALTVYPCLIRMDDGTPVLCIAACYAGPLAEGERAVAGLGRMGDAIDNQLRPTSYLAWQSSMDAARPAGRRCALRSHFLAEIEDGFIEALTEHFAKSPSPLSVAVLEHCHGAIARVAPDATAFALRRNPYHFEIIAFWNDVAQTAVNLEWADRFLAATLPFSTGEVYVNSLDEGEAYRIPEAYGMNYERLRRIKRKHDPTNFFRFNQNIPPSAD